MARPSPLDEWTKPDNLILVEGWVRNGLTNEQIAHNIGVSLSTLYKWKAENEEFSDAFKKGKEVCDLEVERALLKRALGYEYDEEIIEQTKDKYGKVKSQHVKKVRKRVAPDVGAIAFWLKNRKPNDWRDRQEIVDNRAIDMLDEILKGQHESAVNE